MEESLKRRITVDEHCGEVHGGFDESGRPAKTARLEGNLILEATSESFTDIQNLDTKPPETEIESADIDADNCVITNDSSVSDNECSSAIDSLGDEIVIKIFSYLSTRDLLRVACKVNRRWHRLTRAPELWRHIVLDLNKLRLREGMDYRPLLIDDRILATLTSLSRAVLSVDLTDCNGLSHGNSG